MDELLSSGKICESVRNKEGSLITLKVRCRDVGSKEDEYAHIGFSLSSFLHRQFISVRFDDNVCFCGAHVYG